MRGGEPGNEAMYIVPSVLVSGESKDHTQDKHILVGILVWYIDSAVQYLGNGKSYSQLYTICSYVYL